MAEPSEGAGAPGAADETGVAAEAPPEPETRAGAPVTRSRGQLVLHPGRDHLVDLVRTLRDDEAFRVCVDLTAVDYVAYDAPRELPEGVSGE
ncbi:MAG TPA: hypothetical protein VF015_06360, partial [Acidimicrobiales bacterium]